MNPNIFRKYDIRALADVELTDPIIRKIGNAIGTYLVRRGRQNVVFGRDNRHSSKRIADALIDSLLTTGCNIILLGETTTPILNFSLPFFHAHSSIMVTGSHNPPEYNGIKIQIGNTPLHGEQLRSLIDIIQSEDLALARGRLERNLIMPQYIDFMMRNIKIHRALKVVVDCGNGNTSDIAPKLISELGCDVHPLFCTSDGSFPNHHPDPAIRKNLRQLGLKVKESRADVGIAFDGDGNRLGVVDENGQVILPDQVLALLARFCLAESGRITVVCDVKASQALIEDVKYNGGQTIMCKSGYPYLLETIFRHNAFLGGELAGHICINNGPVVFGDAVYVACFLLQKLSKEKNTLSNLFNDYPEYISSPEYRIPCPDDLKFEICNCIKEYFSRQYESISLDGIRIYFNSACWALIRASNTEPKVCVRYEAKEKRDYLEIETIIRGKLTEFGLSLDLTE